MKSKQKRKAFIADVCSCCGQTTNYDAALDKGTAMITLAIYNAVRRLGRNRVHLRDEMLTLAENFPNYQAMVEAGYMTSTMIDNVLRPKYHGLVQQIEGGGAGEYFLTPKGADFLFRNKEVPRVAIVDKKTHSKLYYFNEEDDRVTFGHLMRKETPWWDFNEATLSALGLGPTPISAAQSALPL